MRVVVRGGRDFIDKVRVRTVLSQLHATRGPITYLAEGGQGGSNWWVAALWRKENEVSAFEADLARHGSALIRNGKMIKEGKPDVMISFPGEKSARNMLLQVRMACLEMIEG